MTILLISLPRCWPRYPQWEVTSGRNIGKILRCLIRLHRTWLIPKNSFEVITEKIPADSATVANPLQVQYFGAAPFMFGEDRAMKFSVAPCTKIPQPTLKELQDRNPSENYLREALTETMKGSEAICLDFKIQVRAQGLDTRRSRMRRRRGRKRLPATSMSHGSPSRHRRNRTYRRAIEDCEKLEFTPWHSLEAHRPIGGINRLRQKVYYSSAKNCRPPSK